MTNTTNTVSKIKILSWNYQSIVPKYYETLEYIRKHSIDVVLFSETWLETNKKVSFPRYRFYRVDRKSGDHGGVAIAVNASLKHRHVPSPPTKVIETVAISVDTPSGEIMFISAYFPGSKVTSQILEDYRNDIRILTSIKVPYYVCGDLNSKHRMWNNVRGNAAGFILYQEMSRRPFNVLHSASPTFFPSQRGRSPSNIDIVISNDLLAAEPIHTSKNLVSDHLAIEFSINVETNLSNHAKKAFRFDMADWSRFKSFINDKVNLLSTLKSTTDIDAAIKNFTEVMRQAMLVAIPQKLCKPRFLRLNSEISGLISDKNRCKRKWQRTGDVTFSAKCNALTRLIKKKIEQLRNANWSSKLKNFDLASKKFWQTTKLLKNKTPDMPPLKGNDDTIAYTNPRLH